MDKADKRKTIQWLLKNGGNASVFRNELQEMEDLKPHYYNYMKTAPINCDKELERLPDADYELCTALLTMLLREDDKFGYDSFIRRCEAGQVKKILERMLELLK